MDFPKIMLPLFPMFPTFTLFASETMGPIYFETSQSLQSTNIVFNRPNDNKTNHKLASMIFNLMTNITLVTFPPYP